MILARASLADLAAITALECAGFDHASWSADAWRGEIVADDRLVLVARTLVDDDVSDLEWVGANKVLALVQVNVQRHYRVVDLTDGSTGPPRLLGMDEVTRTDVSPSNARPRRRP